MKCRHLSLIGVCTLSISSLVLSACGESQAQRIQHYINGLGRRGTPNTREVHMKLLIKQGEAAVGPLIRALETRKDPYIRKYAATALAEIGTSSAVEPIRDAMLNDTNAEVRGSAILAFTELERDAAIPDLISVLRNDKDAVPRLLTRQALANIGEPVVDDLIQLLKDTDGFFRAEVRKSLELIGPPAVPQLISALSEKNNTFIIELFRTLAAIGDAAALSPMKTTLQRYPAWDDPVNKRHKNKLYRTLEGYYNDLRNK